MDQRVRMTKIGTILPRPEGTRCSLANVGLQVGVPPGLVRPEWQTNGYEVWYYQPDGTFLLVTYHPDDRPGRSVCWGVQVTLQQLQGWGVTLDFSLVPDMPAGG